MQTYTTEVPHQEASALRLAQSIHLLLLSVLLLFFPLHPDVHLHPLRKEEEAEPRTDGAAGFSTA